jgi:sugar lactone lactonase YvrE
MGKLLSYLSVLLVLSSCATNSPTNTAAPTPITRGALFRYPCFSDQPTGIAVSHNGRIFVNFPRWQNSLQYSVVEVLANGSFRPFPDKEWNRWERLETGHPEAHFICVQSVVVDDDNFLWVVDAASPAFKGVVAGGAKLVKFNLESGAAERVIPFDREVLPQKGYLNDLRIDTERSIAFVTESGMGAIIVIDLKSGRMRRVLADHPSTKAEPGYAPVIDGKELRDESGKVPQIHADGIALDRQAHYLYYHALTAKTLYRIHTSHLEDFHISESELARQVEKVAETGAVDGMEMDRNGNLLFTALEENAIKMYHPQKGIRTIVKDEHLHWPDSMSISPDRYLYFTDSQINLSARFNQGTDKHVNPYSFYKIWLAPF